MRFTNLEQVIARAQEVEAELDELGEKDELTDEETERHDALTEEVGTLVSERKRIETRDEARKAVREIAASTPSAVEDGADKAPQQIRAVEDPYEFEMRGDMPLMSTDELRGAALKAVESESRFSLDDAGKEQITRLLERHDDKQKTIAKIVLATGHKDYRNAWGKMLQNAPYLLTDHERFLMARAASLTDAAGGFAVPFPIDPTLILTNDGAINPIRAISRVESITTDSWQGISAGAVSASYDGEAAEVSDDTPTWAQPSVPVHKAQAFVPYSIEIGQDYNSFAGDIAKAMAEGKDELEATMFATGTGTNQPTGIVTALVAGAVNVVTSATTDVYAVADVYSALEGLPPKYRSRAEWVMNLSIINDTRQFATANNYHAFLTDLSGGNPRRLLGLPLHEASALDGTVTAAAENYIAVVGAWENFLIAERVGMSMENIPHLFATANNRPSGQRGIYAYWRNGSDSVNDNGFALLNVT